MLLPLPRLRSAVCVLVFVVCFCSASQPVCNKHLYGVPNYRDCLSAWNSMPFALEPSGDYKSRRYQLWSEPQYLEPAFGGVVNRFKPLPINQLPKVWRYSTSTLLFLRELGTLKPPVGHCRCCLLMKGFTDTCRLALMSEGRPNGSVVNALWAATWRAILDQMLVLFVCGSPRSGIAPSGGYMGFASV